MIDPEALRPYGEAIVGPYVDYCTNVSRRGMAISIETATLFAYVCANRRARRVLDLGSGFTSYVSRCVADESVSVDDSPEWLDKTRSFLADYRVTTDGLMLWDDWRATPAGPYDVVIHDFAASELRERSMWNAAQVCASGGVVIFDDAQHAGHRATMHNVARRFRMTMVDVRAETEDEVHRYALAAVKS